MRIHDKHNTKSIGNALIYVIIFGAAAMILVAVIFQFAIPGITSAGKESQNTITQAIQKLQDIIGGITPGGSSSSGQTSPSINTQGLTQQETQLAKERVQEVQEQVAKPLQNNLQQWTEEVKTVSARSPQQDTGIVEDTASLQSEANILANPMEGTITIPDISVSLPSFTLTTPQRETVKSVVKITDTTRRGGTLYLKGKIQIDIPQTSKKKTREFEIPIPIEKQLTPDFEMTIGEIAKKLGVNTGPLQPILDTKIAVSPTIPYKVTLNGDFPLQEGKTYSFSGTPTVKGQTQQEPQVTIALHHRGVGKITSGNADEFVKEIRIDETDMQLLMQVQVSEQ